MQHKLGRAVTESNGYTIHRVYLVDENGQYVPAGFAVLSPAGKLLGAFATLKEAEAALEEWSKPTSVRLRTE